MKLHIINHQQDHFVVSTETPMRIEIGLIPGPDGSARIIAHAYRAAADLFGLKVCVSLRPQPLIS